MSDKKLDRSQFKDQDPPFWVAWNQALASIRVRFLRMAITSLGVALGIAFFTSIQTLGLSETSAGPDAKSRMIWLLSTSLMMCLVGVTNSMLMSVTERYREIGTIKCLGASDSFIVRVFFLEAILLGLAGSLSGSLVGVGFMALVLRFTGNPVAGGALAGIILTGTVLGLVMTVVAAIAPAVQAAKMPAAAALRVEV
ncbi:MAG: ABC transporter permease [Fimbriimonas sp.]